MTISVAAQRGVAQAQAQAKQRGRIGGRGRSGWECMVRLNTQADAELEVQGLEIGKIWQIEAKRCVYCHS